MFSYAKSHRRVTALAILAIVCALIGVSYLLPQDTTTKVTETRTVRVVRAGDVAESAPLSVIGSVRSAREALVSPDSSGSVSAVYRSLGDYVGAGTVVAELKNDAQRAGVSQARAALQKTESAVAVGGIGVDNAETSYLTAQESARATLSAAYATISDSIERRIDQMFASPTSYVPKLIVLSSDSQAVNNAEAGRIAVSPILTRQATMVPGAMDPEALLSELTQVQEELKVMQAFAQSVVQSLNGALTSASVNESKIALYRADAAAALASINGLTASVAGAIENLKARRAGVTIAETSLSTDTSGTSADIRVAEANLASALANLERTLIRAPISGTINRLDLEVGSFVQASQPVLYITSAGGLEAVAYVSGNDIADVRTGAKVLVGGTVEGTVVRAANALDPVTKKAEIRVALPATSNLIAGQSATLEITRKAKVGTAATITIPLAALKMTPEGPLAFSVSDESLLTAHPVELGAVRGAFVEIKSGLSADDYIVEDARGLKEGEKVTVEI